MEHEVSPCHKTKEVVRSYAMFRGITPQKKNFGSNYDKTLMAWHKNFNDGWESIKNKYDERFRRMWNYYLLSCAGSFRARDSLTLANHLFQKRCGRWLCPLCPGSRREDESKGK
jgi:cyclopropane fatty-acyl-phospholipid synthase-like methyltransferase